jgi:hypothetical protein
MMLATLLALLLAFVAAPAEAQIPPEWQAAAKAVIGDVEPATAQKPWTNEFWQGWRMARGWRQHNNGNIEIIFAEYLTFTELCRHPGCSGDTIDGTPYREMAAQVMALKAKEGGPYALAGDAHTWLAKLDDPTGAAAKNAEMWGKNLDTAAADVETANLYALYWLLARRQPTEAEQAATFSRFALFAQGKGWIGDRCLDISKVATLLDAPPDIESCK